MSMDIDDILASVDRDRNLLDLASPEATALDHQQLTRFWVTERGVPELLPWPAGLMERVTGRVAGQISKIEDLTASSYSSSSSGNPSTNPTLNLTLSILQSDLSRTQYLLRSLLRQRLAKLTKYSAYYLLLSPPLPPHPVSSSSDDPSSSPAASSQQQQQLSQSTFNTPTPHNPYHNQNQTHPTTTTPLLSPQESTFLHTHQSLLTAHYNASFLSSFPPQLRRLDDNAGGISMVQAPEGKEVVFVRCLAEEVRVVIPVEEDGDAASYREEIAGRRMRRGEVWVVRWEGVKGAWGRGEVEVL
ncbi:GINS complex subunit [Emmonsiellopsis sp. PD_33]|nr:GINS complex subunit [Emmonsiellopsis sp. PD_33]